MEKSFLTEVELKEFKERLQATWKMGEKYQAKLAHPSNVSQFNILDVIITFYSERLDKSSRTLNYLTNALIVLTIVLTILTGISVWKLFH